MPRRRRYRRTNRRRFRRKRKRRSNNRPANLQTSVRKTLLRDKFKSNLLYADFFRFDPSGAAPALVIYSCNSLFDPDRTNVGHQPRGFDQFMQFYDHYTVIAAKISVQFGTAASGSEAPMVGISVFDDAGPRTFNEMRECGTTKSQILTRDSNRTITMTINPAKFLGRSHPLSDPQLRGDDFTSVPNNPIEECFFHVWVDGQSIDTGIIQVSVTINYVAIFTEPLTPTSS